VPGRDIRSPAAEDVWQAGAVVDRQFADARLAALYDLFCPWEPRGDFSFYLIRTIGHRRAGPMAVSLL
jgi:hypothetical protein